MDIALVNKLLFISGSERVSSKPCATGAPSRGQQCAQSPLHTDIITNSTALAKTFRQTTSLHGDITSPDVVRGTVMHEKIVMDGHAGFLNLVGMKLAQVIEVTKTVNQMMNSPHEDDTALEICIRTLTSSMM